MNNKRTGALLLGAAGLAAAVGAAGAQIANAIVLGGFYAGNMSGEVPPSPEGASLHWVVMTAVAALALLGLFYLLRSASET